MFDVSQPCKKGNWCIREQVENRDHRFMHRDGEIVLNCAEYWPAKEQAQAVLDKYQPPHVWEHGDIFDVGGCKMMYLHWYDHRAGVIHLDMSDTYVHNSVADYLCNATFLFNIKSRL